MAEPFDELVGSSAERKMENLKSTTTKSNAPPPSNAFSHSGSSSSSDRWSVSMAKIRAESALESSRSSARHSLPPTASYQFRRSHSDASNPASSKTRRSYDWREEDTAPQDESLKKVLGSVDDNLASKYHVHRSSDGSFSADVEPYVVRRTESGKIVTESKDPQAPYSVSRTASGTITSGEHSSSKRRVPSALSGLGFGRKSDAAADAAIKGRFSFKDSSFMADDVLDDDDVEDYLEEEDDIIVRRDEKELANTSRAARAMASLEDKDLQGDKSSWSSRYRVDKTLLAMQGGLSGNEILHDMDRDGERTRMSARNMFASSAYNMKAMIAQEKGKVFGSGFSFRQTSVFGKQQQQGQTNLRTAWKDVDIGAGSSLPPPPPVHKTWQQALLNKQKRRRNCIVVLLLLLAVCIVTITTVRATNGSKAGAIQSQGDGIGSGVTFYVTSNVPYDIAEEDKLIKDLRNIPGDAEFIVHLGNIQDSSVSLCPRSRYSDVASILKKSPVPMFLVPGEHDWARCPNPEDSLNMWRDSFGAFENNVNHGMEVMRHADRAETFSVLHKGVLFFGLHLVNGPIDPLVLKEMQEDTLRFFYGMMNLNKGQFRSIVIFGNARPGPLQDGIFGAVLDAIDNMGLPVAYIHANNDGVIEQYTPFSSHDLILGVQVEDGGRNPPLKINVGFGNRPFFVG